MNERMQDRLFAACGVASVALALAGTAIATVAREDAQPHRLQHAAQIAHALAKPAGPACGSAPIPTAQRRRVPRLRRLGAASSAAAARRDRPRGRHELCDAHARLPRPDGRDRVPRRARPGRQLGRTLVTVNEALYVCTWFLSVFFLLAAGPLALTPAGVRSAGARSASPSSRSSARDLVQQLRPVERACSGSRGRSTRASRSHVEMRTHARSVCRLTVQHA